MKLDINPQKTSCNTLYIPMWFFGYAGRGLVVESVTRGYSDVKVITNIYVPDDRLYLVIEGKMKKIIILEGYEAAKN